MNVSLQSKPSTVPVQVADADKIVMGAGFRLPPALAHVTDSGKIRLGAGFRLPVEHKTA